MRRDARPSRIPGPSGDAAGDGTGGVAEAAPRRRAPVPKRTEGAVPTLAQEEARELREALGASKQEKDVLQCEVHALRLELETMKELMSA